MCLTWMVLLHIKSPATESNLYLQRIGCKYDLRTTFLNCYQSGFLCSLPHPQPPPHPRLSTLQLNPALVHKEKAGRSHRSPVSQWPLPARASCSALFTADSVIILIGALLSYHIVVLSELFPLRLCFLAGLFLPYWQFVKICINLEFQACIMVSLCCVCLKLINDRTSLGLGLWRVLSQVPHVN